MEVSNDLEVWFSRVFREGGSFEEGIAVVHIGCPNGGREQRGVERRLILISYAFNSFITSSLLELWS